MGKRQWTMFGVWFVSRYNITSGVYTVIKSGSKGYVHHALLAGSTFTRPSGRERKKNNFMHMTFFAYRSNSMLFRAPSLMHPGYTIRRVISSALFRCIAFYLALFWAHRCILHFHFLLVSFATIFLRFPRSMYRFICVFFVETSKKISHNKILVKCCLFV